MDTRLYKTNCDGDWERMYGVKIDNIDNPGWSVVIDLVDTVLIDKQFEEVSYDLDNDNWILCFVKDGVFKGSGGYNKLEEILIIFKNWVEDL